METKDPKKQIRSIGVLTSGGDAPGMNAAIRAVVRTALNFGIDVYGIYDGYRGLVEGNIVKMDRSSVTDIINRGGTILGSARLKEFASPEVTQIGIDNLRKLGIDALVTIGGDGTYHGALRMSRMGLNCIGLPGTIDNDIASNVVDVYIRFLRKKIDEGFETKMIQTIRGVGYILKCTE